jgi:hypothetical protein
MSIFILLWQGKGFRAHKPGACAGPLAFSLSLSLFLFDHLLFFHFFFPCSFFSFSIHQCILHITQILSTRVISRITTEYGVH